MHNSIDKSNNHLTWNWWWAKWTQMMTQLTDISGSQGQDMFMRQGCWHARQGDILHSLWTHNSHLPIILYTVISSIMVPSDQNFAHGTTALLSWKLSWHVIALCIFKSSGSSALMMLVKWVPGPLVWKCCSFHTSRPDQNGQHSADNICKWVFL